MLSVAVRPLATPQNLLDCEGSSSLEAVVEKQYAGKPPTF
tara:strand:- start:156 stop:275 length:120 start_codon:yes stop_codon:yes gene_type:complete